MFSLIKLTETKLVDIRETNEEECDENWSELDKQGYIKEMKNEVSDYEQIYEKILNGFKPDVLFDTSIKTGCYLFGCGRHNHPEYNELLDR